MINRNAERTIVKRLRISSESVLYFWQFGRVFDLGGGAAACRYTCQKSVEARRFRLREYKIDPRHSFAYFSAWHHLVGRVRAVSIKFQDHHRIADPAACSVDVTIDVATISTQSANVMTISQ